MNRATLALLLSLDAIPLTKPRESRRVRYIPAPAPMRPARPAERTIVRGPIPRGAVGRFLHRHQRAAA